MSSRRPERSGACQPSRAPPKSDTVTFISWALRRVKRCTLSPDGRAPHGSETIVFVRMLGSWIKQARDWAVLTRAASVAAVAAGRWPDEAVAGIAPPKPAGTAAPAAAVPPEPV